VVLEVRAQVIDPPVLRELSGRTADARTLRAGNRRQGHRVAGVAGLSVFSLQSSVLAHALPFWWMLRGRTLEVPRSFAADGVDAGKAED
jgi:hypothetical protein